MFNSSYKSKDNLKKKKKKKKIVLFKILHLEQFTSQTSVVVNGLCNLKKGLNSQ